MKTRLFLVGLIALGFGIINIFWYAPHSLALVFMNQPFPFPHLQDVEIHEGRGIGTQIVYDPFLTALQDPYWLIWSLSLYAGVAILSILVVTGVRK